MFRKLIGKFNRTLTENMVSSRRRHTAQIKIWFEPEINSERSRDIARAACVYGETYDISRTGVSFIVPSIRMKEKYLVGHDRILNIEIELPTGKVALKVIGRRYQKVGVHISTERFLIGAHIVRLAGEDKEIYDTFLRKGQRGMKTVQGSLELGID